MTTTPAENRIWFLQLCRAFACLIVVYVHWMTFVQNPNELLKILNLPLFNNYPDIPSIGIFISSIGYYLPSIYREAFFGVGLFFLISGFVIPFSMEKISPYEFLFRRIMRVYPTVFVCVSIATLLLIAAQYLSNPLGIDITFKQLVGNIFLITKRLRVQFIEHGLWTLEIEARFYILCFVLAFFKGHRKGLVLIFVPTIISIVCGKIYAAYISFMLVGTCLFNWSDGKWSGKKTCLFIILLMMINRHYLVKEFHHSKIDLAGMIYANHFYVLLAFILLLLLNKKLAYSAFMDKIADISYSLYLVHGTAAYSIYFMSYYLLHNVMIAVFATAVWIICSSFLIHRYVEKPSIHLPKQFVKWLKAKRNPQPELQSEASAS